MTRLGKTLRAFSLTTAIAATSVIGQPLIQVDEYGTMLINGLPGPPGVIGVEPISGIATLCYQLPFPVNGGDILLIEPQQTNVLSDIIRFSTSGQMYFFSDHSTNEPPEPGVLADGPLPPIINPFVVFTEVGPEAGPNGLFGYVPGPGGIGGSPGAIGLTYDFFSDGRVPEPSSVALVGFGSLVALLCRRSRRG